MIVLSRHPRPLPPRTPDTVTVTDAAPIALVAQLADRGLQHLFFYIDGGITIHRFLAAHLINELTLTQIPVLLGAGRPLFVPLPRDLSLELLSTRGYPCGFVQSHYRVLRDK
ncbi:dihydrofolate reductase family protein [Trichothermofontia sp.]